jgi:hypothetical protein
MHTMRAAGQLPGRAENRRGGGGLIQLCAHGVSDCVPMWGEPMPCLVRRGPASGAAYAYAFLEKQGDYPSADDRRSASGALSMLAHVPDAQAPSRADVTRPFRVRSEPDWACWEARAYTPDDLDGLPKDKFCGPPSCKWF